MREQGQRRLQARKEWLRGDLIYIKWKHVCKKKMQAFPMF